MRNTNIPSGEPTAGSASEGFPAAPGSTPVIINANGSLTPLVFSSAFSILNSASLPRSLSYAMGRRSSNMSPGEYCTLNTLEMEAIAAVHELRMFVKDAYVSDLLPRTPELVFINVTTLEGQAFCIELTVKGWRVTSMRHDCMNGDFSHLELHTRYFETIYSLMDIISPAYRHGFTELLAWRLRTLDSNRSGSPTRGSDPGESDEVVGQAEWKQGVRISASTPVTPCSTPLRSQAREAACSSSFHADATIRKLAKISIPSVAEEDVSDVQKSAVL